MATMPIAVLTEAGALAGGDEMLAARAEILGALYMAHYAYVLQVCRRFFRQREDAEDAASEVFLKLYKILDKKDASCPFRPWISRVAGRHCIDTLRHRKYEQKSCAEGVDVSEVRDDLTLSPLADVQRREEEHLLREQLFRLPEHYMLPLVLHYYKQMSYNEMARTLNRALPAVKTTMHRAKHALRRNLEESSRRDSAMLSV